MLSLHSPIDAVLGRVLTRLRSIQPGGEVYDTAMNEAATGHLTACTRRIHTDGRASDGSDIGQYSTGPLYVNAGKSSASLQPTGKTGKTTFAKTGKPHLTRYYAQGYKAYRQDLGLPSDRIVLSLRGDLRDGLAVMQTERGYGLGWSDEGLYQLAQSIEKRYGKQIWSATEEERGASVGNLRKGIDID